MKTKLIAAKNFVVENKVAITATAVAIAATALVVRNQKLVNEFLEEKGLLEEFYTID
jgi:hypothetical protein